jgi:hypothetical protein
MSYALFFKFFERRITQKILGALSDGETQFEIYFRGFGNRGYAKLATIESTKIIRMEKFQSISFSANYMHAYAELDSQKLGSFFPGTSQKFSKVARRAISIGLYSRSFFSGVINGFAITYKIDRKDIDRVPKLLFPLGRVRFARASASVGFVIPVLETLLENEIRRKDINVDVQVVDVFFTPQVGRGVFQRFYRRAFPHFLTSIVNSKDLNLALLVANSLPPWHYARSYFTLNFNQADFGAINVYRKAHLKSCNGSFSFEPTSINSQIHWSDNSDIDKAVIASYLCKNADVIDGRFVVVDGYLLPDETTLIEQVESIGGWPWVIWSKKESNFVAVPNFIDEVLLDSLNLFIQSNPNWAHFFEEILPRIVVAERDFEIDNIRLTRIHDAVQSEAIRSMTFKDVILVDRFSRYKASNLVSTVSENRRSLAMKGQLSGLEMLDEVSIRSIRLAAKSLLERSNSIQYPARLYIKRKNTLFRRLTNKNTIESILKKFDFEFIKAEDLTYLERVAIFSNAKIIVAESGAGLANSHFCERGTVVLEMRHPGMVLSEEESAFSDLEITWIKVVGKTANFLQRFLIGTDSYKIEHKQFRTALFNIIHKSENDAI